MVCCHLLSGVACLWTWRNPGPHSCVNQSESEASFSVEKSATASIIRHLPPSLQIVLDFVYRNLTLLKIRCYWKWTKRENSSLLSSDTLSSPPPPGSLLIGSDFDSSFQMDQFVPAQHSIAIEHVVIRAQCCHDCKYFGKILQYCHDCKGFTASLLCSPSILWSLAESVFLLIFHKTLSEGQTCRLLRS